MGTAQSTNQFGQPVPFNNQYVYNQSLQQPIPILKTESQTPFNISLDEQFTSISTSTSSEIASFPTGTLEAIAEVPIVGDESNKTDYPNGLNTGSDGYKWRKYGQKFVKGRKQPRSYYKCTYPGCPVKKYIEIVEEAEDLSQPKEIVEYKGTHTHDPSRITKLNARDQLSFKNSVVAESLSNESDDSTDDEKDESNAIAGTKAPNTPQRLVVETTIDVDHLDDGYNWRKYGQKVVKGTSFVRSYYKCTEENCPVKKQVERRNTIIVNTYDGIHNHLAPGFEEALSKRKNKRKLETVIGKVQMPLLKRTQQAIDSIQLSSPSTNLNSSLV